MTEEKKKAIGAWGITGPQFIHGLRGKEVLVSVSTGKTFRGVLIGADPYNLILRQESGLEMLVGKGNVVYLHAVGNHRGEPSDG
jgi:small nuclear ribonucleoprotein (snRNP)-like protein